MLKSFTKFDKNKDEKLVNLKIFYQVDHVKKLSDEFDKFDDDSSLLKNQYDHRAFVRRIRKEYKKIKRLTMRKCITIYVETKNKTMKTLLNFKSEINFINKAMIKQLNFFSTLNNEKATIIINTKLKIFEIHFLIITVTNKHDVQRHFEKFFLKININENIILNIF